MNTILPLLALLALPALAGAAIGARSDATGIDGSSTGTDDANPIVITTGAEGGGYWGLGQRLADAADKRGGHIEVRPSAGSLENLQRLDDPTDASSLGLTQADALSVYLRQQPMFAGRFKTLESIGKECVFIIAASDSGINNLADLQQQGRRLAISGESSGTAVTFRAMQTLQPALAATKVVNIETMQAITELGKPPGQRRVDALMMVHRPKLRSEALKHALFDQQHYRLVAVRDPQLQAELPGGKPVYTPIKLPLIRDDWSTRVSIDTLCMDGLLLSIPDKLDTDQRQLLQHTVELDWMQIYPEPGQ